MNVFLVQLLALLIGLTNPPNEVDQEKIPIIIDADTANEVDDLFALVRAIKEPSFDLLGITSAQFHTSPLATDTTVLESQHINEEIVQLLKREDLPLPVGSNDPLKDKNTPQRSEASNFIVSKAKLYSPEDPLHLVILGSCTNVASAVLQDPSIVPNIKVSYIGFWHDVENNVFNKKEFNSGNDTLAVEVLLDTEGLDFDVMTATTCQQLVFEKQQVQNEVKKIGEIGPYLLDRWNSYERWWTKEDPEKNSWIMWDVAIIEALAKPQLAIKKDFETPEENTPRTIEAYTSIDVELMIADFWEALK